MYPVLEPVLNEERRVGLGRGALWPVVSWTMPSFLNTRGCINFGFIALNTCLAVQYDLKIHILRSELK